MPLAQALAADLTKQRYVVDIAANGEEGWNFIEAAAYDLVVLDISLPKLDGISLCQRIRLQGHTVPILLLTAKDQSRDKVRGLDAGADDYLVKPCTLEEFCARIRALLRRGDRPEVPTLEWGELHLDPNTCEVSYQQKPCPLSSKEHGLLELFLRNPRRVFSSGAILEHLWTFGETPGEETVRAHIKRLRRKLKAVGADDVIETIHGMGYRLKPLPEEQTDYAEPEASVAEQARLAAQTAWEQLNSYTQERLHILDQLVVALQTGSASATLRSEARHAAHKLSGSLGMFGFPEGSQIAQNLEALLEDEETSDAVGLLEAIATAVMKLHRLLPPETRQSADQAQDSETTVAQLPRPSAADPTDVHVLAVDDDPLILAHLKHFLRGWGIHVTPLGDPRQLWHELETTHPDLLILDVEMPHISGIELCQQIRSNPTWDGLPILFLTSHQNAEVIHQIYGARADDYVPKPFTEPELVTRILNRLERTRLLRSLAEPHAGAGIADRHSFTADLAIYLKLARRFQQTVHVAIAAIDASPPFSHQPDQAVSDDLIQRAAEVLQQAFQDEGCVAHWSTAEFAIALYGLNEAEVKSRLNQVHTVLRQTAAPIALHIGIAVFPSDGTDGQNLLDAAHAALMQAQRLKKVP